MTFESVDHGDEDEAQQPIKPARCRCYMPATATPPSVITAADQVRRNLRMSAKWARFGRLMVEQLLAEHDAAVERAQKAERELAELRERMIGNGWRQEWGVQHPLLGTEYVQGSENARYLCRTRNEEHPGYEWRVVKRLTGEWKAADDA